MRRNKKERNLKTFPVIDRSRERKREREKERKREREKEKKRKREKERKREREKERKRERKKEREKKKKPPSSFDEEPHTQKHQNPTLLLLEDHPQASMLSLPPFLPIKMTVRKEEEGKGRGKRER